MKDREIVSKRKKQTSTIKSPNGHHVRYRVECSERELVWMMSLEKGANRFRPGSQNDCECWWY